MSDTWIEIDLPLGCVRIQTVLGWQEDTLEGCHGAEVGMQSRFILPASAQVTSSRKLSRTPAHSDFHLPRSPLASPCQGDFWGQTQRLAHYWSPVNIG